MGNDSVMQRFDFVHQDDEELVYTAEMHSIEGQKFYMVMWNSIEGGILSVIYGVDEVMDYIREGHFVITEKYYV